MGANIGSYEERRRDFDWRIAWEELGYHEGDPLNIGAFCSDHQVARGLGQRTALIWESATGEVRRFTFADLSRYSNAFGHFLRGLGVKPGDRVCLFMDRIPELYIAFLGILKIGAVAMPLFSAFGEDALLTRVQDAEAVAVLTTLKLVRRIRKMRDRAPSLAHIVVVDGTGARLREGEIPFEMTSAEAPDDFEVHAADWETPSVLHYTSGTTGKPKGALHVHSSIFSQLLTARWVLDLRDDDIYWCTADPGWVTGTSYGIIGPWSLGVTQVVLDSGMIIDRWYRLIEKHRITVWYSAPTAIRILMREGADKARQFDLSSLRHLCSVGEPLNPEAVIWSGETFGHMFHDTYWQTETGCIVIANYPGMKIKPGSMGKPFPGITATVLDPETLQPLDSPGKVGLLALKPGWPSMFRAYWNNPETYASKFKNGWYLCGDRGMIDEDGYFWFVGRDDDVINTAGHLVSPFEIESALLEHPAVAESAAIGKPDPVNMEVVKAFIALKPGFEPGEELELAIMNFVRKRLSALAMPQEIEFVDSLPKTRSGKILRRLLRCRETGEPVGDLSTLEDD